MKKLANEFNKRGFAYRTLDRFETVNKAGNTTYWGCFELSVAGEVLEYELCKIKQGKEKTIAGTVIEAAESLVGDREWGKYGWSFLSIAGMWRKKDRLINGL
jgi:hypothetical protein